ncbi:MAG: MFS transporter [Armatimonadota bacterium]
MSDEHNDRSRDMLVPFNQRTYRLGIANGVFGYTGSRLADPNTIVPLLIHRLSGAAWIVGLVLGLKGIVEAVAQVVAARSLDSKDRKKPAYILGSLTQSLTYVTVALVMWFANAIPDTVVLLVFVVALLGYRAGLALSGLTLNDILTKSVPTTRRGSLHMWRKLGALVVVFFAVTPFVAWIIGPEGPFEFPRNFGILFAASVASTGCGWLLFAQAAEPPSRLTGRKLRWSEHLRHGLTLFRGDRCYRRVIRIRLLVGIAAGVRPFLVVFATDIWGLSDDVAATFIAIQVCAEFFGAAVTGALSDRRGNRRAILFMIWSIVLCCAAAVAAAASTWDTTVTLLAWQVNLQIIILGAAFVGSGLFLASLQIGYNNYLMDISPEDQRPSYIGFSTAFTVPLAIAPILYGWGADVLGYQPAFVSALVLSLGALYLFLQLPEPRDELDGCDLEQFRRPPPAERS